MPRRVCLPAQCVQAQRRRATACMMGATATNHCKPPPAEWIRRGRLACTPFVTTTSSYKWPGRATSANRGNKETKRSNRLVRRTSAPSTNRRLCCNCALQPVVRAYSKRCHKAICSSASSPSALR
eukprot:363278-Chlamydomonas_euryale.AAC.1